jgi:hypothetical protein
MTSSPVQAQRGTDERERLAKALRTSSVPSIDDQFLAADMLRADAEQLRALEAWKSLQLEAASELREQLRARDEEIAGLRKDAERYRWIRDECTRADNLDGMLLSADPDASIDAAIAKGRPCLCGETTVEPYCPRCAKAFAALQEKSRDAG